MVAPWKKSSDQPRQHIKKQRHYFANKSLSSQGYDFSSSHVWMWELDHKENWRPKNWCFWENSKLCWRKLLSVSSTARRSNQSVLKEIVLHVHWKDWYWSWNSNIWPPDGKNWLTGKDPDVGEDCRQEEKGMTEDEMAGWHHRRNRHELVQAPGIGDGQGSQACCRSWGCRVGHDWVTELN